MNQVMNKALEDMLATVHTIHDLDVKKLALIHENLVVASIDTGNSYLRTVAETIWEIYENIDAPFCGFCMGKCRGREHHF